MRRVRLVALAAGLPVAMLAAPEELISAAPHVNELPATVSTDSTLPGSAPATEPYLPPGEVPSDWVYLSDETQTISISVPSSWTAIDLAPGVNQDGSSQPWISATTDKDLFFPAEGTADTYSVPGILYRAFPLEADPAARLATSNYNGLCTAGPMQPFDNGSFVGHIQSFNDCGGTASDVTQVAASRIDDAFTAFLLVQLTGQEDDDETLGGLLESMQ